LQLARTEDYCYTLHLHLHREFFCIHDYSLPPRQPSVFARLARWQLIVPLVMGPKSRISVILARNRLIYRKFWWDVLLLNPALLLIVRYLCTGWYLIAPNRLDDQSLTILIAKCRGHLIHSRIKNIRKLITVISDGILINLQNERSFQTFARNIDNVNSRALYARLTTCLVNYPMAWHDKKMTIRK